MQKFIIKRSKEEEKAKPNFLPIPVNRIMQYNYTVMLITMFCCYSNFIQNKSDT